MKPKFSLLDLAAMFENSEDDLVLVGEELMKWPEDTVEYAILKRLETEIAAEMATIEEAQNV